ncbi:MAG: hypothetical protein M0R37_10440 [Bacteroidales bacterium]|nr:hypothetical protein [Bacteroidales bacterium]
MPDPDAAEVIIGCAQDAEADAFSDRRLCDLQRYAEYALKRALTYEADEPFAYVTELIPVAVVTSTEARTVIALIAELRRLRAITDAGQVQQSAPDAAPSVPCPTCGGAWDERRHRHPSPHLWSGSTWAGDECQSQSKREYCTDSCHDTGVKQVERTVDVALPYPCPTCGGSGNDPTPDEYRHYNCPTCHGTGVK